MRNWHWSMISLAALAMGAQMAAAEPTAEEIRCWVAQLNDDDYAIREEAAKKLTETGAAAIEALVEGVASDQAEVAWRAGAALEQIGLEGDAKTIDLIVKHLDAARAKSGRDGLKTLATELHARQRQFRRERAVGKIREHGGHVAGTGIDGGIDEVAMAMPFAGPVMVLDEPVLVEGFAEAVPPPEMPVVEAIEVVDEVGKGLFGGIARAIAKALIPEVAPPPPAVDVVPRDADAVEVKEFAERAVEEIEAEEAPAKVLEDGLRELKAGLGAADKLDVEVAVEAVAVADVAIGIDMMGMGGMAIDGGSTWAQLVLDQNWRGDDDVLAVLADLPELSQIELRQAPVGDKALAHFAKLPKLAMISTYGGKLTRDGLLKFREARPNVTVYCRGDALMGVNADLGTSPLVLTSVFPASGASDAGLQVGDVIRAIDGVAIRDFSDLTICVATRKPGDKVQVEYQRSGKKGAVEITLKTRTGEE